MRRTVFVTTLDIAALIQAACGRAVAARERRKVLGWLAESGVGDDADGWLAEVEQAALRPWPPAVRRPRPSWPPTIRG